jgi:hypothetical protein
MERMLSGNDDLSITHPEIKGGRILNNGEPARMREHHLF